ncbi:hypothetical protein [Chromobacterium sp. ASV23]|uniref:hypothetical protein n=1 Tax=Chromobacterium sp. ASV23 TaxID=2795110 RepID=UPI0018EB2C01|nr:hypothetical protein [Chromobacterium sp. ASV23]
MEEDRVTRAVGLLTIKSRNIKAIPAIFHHCVSELLCYISFEPSALVADQDVVTSLSGAAYAMHLGCIDRNSWFM